MGRESASLADLHQMAQLRARCRCQAPLSLAPAPSSWGGVRPTGSLVLLGKHKRHCISDSFLLVAGPAFPFIDHSLRHVGTISLLTRDARLCRDLCYIDSPGLSFSGTWSPLFEV